MLLALRSLVEAQGSNTLIGATGTYVVTGQSASFKVVHNLTAVTGSYSLTGVAASFKVAHTLSATVGSYTYTGVAATFKNVRTLLANTGSYSLTGIAATFNYVAGAGSIAYSLSGATGSYSLSGQVALFKQTHNLTAVKGTYTFSGIAATFNYVSGAVGSIVSSVSGFSTTSINLTSLGGTDWAEWNFGSTTPDQRKLGGGSLISNATIVGFSVISSDTTTRVVSWTDGTPTLSGNNATNAGLWGDDGAGIVNVGDGTSFTVPASTGSRQVKVICSVLGGASYKIISSLSDGSFATQTTTTTVLGAATKSSFTATIDYKAASVGQTLTVQALKATENSGGEGYVALQAVVLKVLPVNYSLTGNAGSYLIAANDASFNFSGASIGAPSYESYVVKKGNKLFVFKRKQDALNALNDDVETKPIEPVKKQTKAKTLKQKVIASQAQETYDLNAVLAALNANAQAQYFANKQKYEALIRLYEEYLDEQDVELLLLFG